MPLHSLNWKHAGPNLAKYFWQVDWLDRYRRFAPDFEHTVASSEEMTYLAGIRRMLKLTAN